MTEAQITRFDLLLRVCSGVSLHRVEDVSCALLDVRLSLRVALSVIASSEPSVHRAPARIVRLSVLPSVRPPYGVSTLWLRPSANLATSGVSRLRLPRVSLPVEGVCTSPSP